jgi:hypothetical protein
VCVFYSRSYVDTVLILLYLLTYTHSMYTLYTHTQWVRDSFTRKEALLKEFYANCAPESHSDSSSDGDSSAVAANASRITPCILKSWPPLISHPLSATQSSFSQSTLPIIIMFSLMMGLTLSLWYVTLTQYYLCVVSLVYTFCVYVLRPGGIDNLELRIHEEGGSLSGENRDKTD